MSLEKGRQYYQYERKDLLALVPPSAKKILEIGCGEANFGKAIKERNPDVEYTGVEMDKASAQIARQRINKVIEGNIDILNLPFDNKYFDCIITLDLLEHLADPWQTIKKLRPLLDDHGVWVVSIPNVRHYRVIYQLLTGYWDYTQQGILDKTHLRFFTFIGMKEMFAETGFKIKAIGRNIDATNILKIAHAMSFNLLEDFVTYQYYLVLEKDTERKTTRRLHKS